MKKAVVYAIILLCVALMYRYPRRMLNPGALVQGHQELKDQCSDCHTPFGGIQNGKCEACHKLSEIGRDTMLLPGGDTTRTKVLFHEKLTGQPCTSCHTDHKGVIPAIPVSNFSHEMLPGTVIANCSSCHGKPSGNLHAALSTDCKSCHNTTGWDNNVKFNHEMIQGTAKANCEFCHNKPDDSYHHLFTENCDKCHSTDRWVPSTFDHSEYFQLDKDHNVTCNTCHTNNNFSAFTCYGCHEHTESKIIRKHQEEGIRNISNCARCHKNSDEHDIRMDGNGQYEPGPAELNKIKDYIKKEEENGKKHHDDD